MAKSRPQKASRPEKAFRIGFVSASVFAHELESDDGPRTVRSVSLQKHYRDGDDVKYVSSFNLSELPQASEFSNSSSTTSSPTKPNSPSPTDSHSQRAGSPPGELPAIVQSNPEFDSRPVTHHGVKPINGAPQPRCSPSKTSPRD